MMERDRFIVLHSLFALLEAAVLIERVLFAIFRNRLQLVPEVTENRELLERYFEQVKVK